MKTLVDVVATVLAPSLSRSWIVLDEDSWDEASSLTMKQEGIERPHDRLLRSMQLLECWRRSQPHSDMTKRFGRDGLRQSSGAQAAPRRRGHCRDTERDAENGAALRRVVCEEFSLETEQIRRWYADVLQVFLWTCWLPGPVAAVRMGIRQSWCDAVKMARSCSFRSEPSRAIRSDLSRCTLELVANEALQDSEVRARV